ncbi:hypothetical protein MCOR27_000921 [Pyricularia oryzae]|uniref:HIT domain-containing protein n=5 Tax=Pyricularia TaxID=48558 RepID=A0ABQ8N7P5_PYRGI|nr:uncharacterized protein MGG_00100 [Pyricularia oryzae 70-15]ELQ32558.1 HIT domain-containing protein [Pyricularia oryzae Y34]KAH8841387.1 hypothetical protein MCOR01_008054 [Pyricularia oryzae]KAI6292617.1 hypothetical protein MCOR33_009721 [Pyricularia grisea]EHA49456.1 hypothetical protein MGG_00100 [Pyricularia oryzae 70-15]KAH9433273.1 hypothetical protein MCOR02_005326 [Pyricularia oryzae]
MGNTGKDEPPVPEDGRCPFCNISNQYQPYDPQAPPPGTSESISPARTRTDPDTFVLLSTPLLVAFLDIMPLSRGHVLLCPRAHRRKLTAVTAAEARELGFFVRVLSEAVMRATGVGDWNVVQNNGAAAAQVVPHMHFHIIPRPEIREQGRWSDRFTMFGRGQRSDLDEDEAVELAARIRECVAEVLREEEEQGGQGFRSKL